MRIIVAKNKDWAEYDAYVVNNLLENGHEVRIFPHTWELEVDELPVFLRSMSIVWAAFSRDSLHGWQMRARRCFQVQYNGKFYNLYAKVGGKGVLYGVVAI